MHTHSIYTCQHRTLHDTMVSLEALDSRVMRVNIWTKQTKLKTLQRKIIKALSSAWMSQSTVRRMAIYVIAFPIDTGNNEFQIHYFLTTFRFQTVTGRVMLHQAAAGRPARRLLCHCEYHRLQVLHSFLRSCQWNFVLVISLELEVRVQWFLVTHHRQLKRRASAWQRCGVSLITLTILII